MDHTEREREIVFSLPRCKATVSIITQNDGSVCAFITAADASHVQAAVEWFQTQGFILDEDGVWDNAGWQAFLLLPAPSQ